MSYKSENKAAREQLEADIKRYLASGHKIEQVPLGKSTTLDMTNGWHDGFCIDDNVGFGRKYPRGVARDV